jgi:phosphatidylinositol phospholipase C delta
MTTYRVCCFRRRFRPASNEPSEAIGDLFQSYASDDSGVLGEEALRRFLREVQGEISDDDLEESAREVMAFAAEQKLLKKGGGGLTVEAFHRWLSSDANAALHPRRGVSYTELDPFACTKIIVFLKFLLRLDFGELLDEKFQDFPWSEFQKEILIYFLYLCMRGPYIGYSSALECSKQGTSRQLILFFSS